MSEKKKKEHFDSYSVMRKEKSMQKQKAPIFVQRMNQYFTEKALFCFSYASAITCIGVSLFPLVSLPAAVIPFFPFFQYLVQFNETFFFFVCERVVCSVLNTATGLLQYLKMTYESRSPNYTFSYVFVYLSTYLYLLLCRQVPITARKQTDKDVSSLFFCRYIYMYIYVSFRLCLPRHSEK